MYRVYSDIRGVECEHTRIDRCTYTHTHAHSHACVHTNRLHNYLHLPLFFLSANTLCICCVMCVPGTRSGTQVVNMELRVEVSANKLSVESDLDEESGV